jgi:hypothetical protein
MLGVHNPAGADWGEILVGLRRLFAAAQPERYAANPYHEKFL